MLQVPGELEKGNAVRLLPIAPEFALFLLETPEADRTGPLIARCLLADDQEFGVH